MIPLWFLFALLYGLFHAGVNLFDKYVLKNKNIDTLSFSSFRFIINSSVAFVLVLLFFSFTVPTHLLFWIFVFGIAVIYFIAVISYFFAVKLEDVSKLIPFGQSSLVFLSFVLSLVLLSETTTIYDILGTVAIIIGSYIISTDGRLVIPKLSKGLVFISVWAITLALFGVFSKPLTQMVQPPVLNLLTYSFVMIFLLAINSTKFDKFKTTVKILVKDKKLLISTFSASILATVGTLLLFIALLVGNASEVLPLSRVQPLFTVLLGGLILKEKKMFTRLLGSAIIVIGIFLFYI